MMVGIYMFVSISMISPSEEADETGLELMSLRPT